MYSLCVCLLSRSSPFNTSFIPGKILGLIVHRHKEFCLCKRKAVGCEVYEGREWKSERIENGQVVGRDQEIWIDQPH